MTYWTTQNFKALQKAWYNRLKAAGFEDAEEMVQGEMVLKQNAAHVYRGLDQLALESKESYFNFIAQKVEETAWTNAIDRLILSRHAEGKKIKHICEELREVGAPRARNTVRFKIRLYEMKWGLRTYTAKELNRKSS